MRYILLLLPFLLLAQKPQLLLLKKYTNQNITGWVMSEKLDGIRAYWDGNKLLTRNGKEIHAPKWFTKAYPPFEIDGELWTKRKDFENISSIVRDQVPSEQWIEVKHYIFEVPNATGDLRERLAKVKPYEGKIIQIIPQIAIRDREHLADFHKNISSQGGEGVVVRDPSTPYINKRTNKALKLKKFNDAECEVIGYTKGKGLIRNLVGALKCRLESGIEFKVGSGLSNADRRNPPSIGTIDHYRYPV